MRVTTRSTDPPRRAARRTMLRETEPPLLM
jgi:hypothetical protein